MHLLEMQLANPFEMCTNSSFVLDSLGINFSAYGNVTLRIAGFSFVLLIDFKNPSSSLPDVDIADETRVRLTEPLTLDVGL